MWLQEVHDRLKLGECVEASGCSDQRSSDHTQTPSSDRARVVVAQHRRCTQAQRFPDFGRKRELTVYAGCASCSHVTIADVRGVEVDQRFDVGFDAGVIRDRQYITGEDPRRVQNTFSAKLAGGTSGTMYWCS